MVLYVCESVYVELTLIQHRTQQDNLVTRTTTHHNYERDELANFYKLSVNAAWLAASSVAGLQFVPSKLIPTAMKEKFSGQQVEKETNIRTGQQTQLITATASSDYPTRSGS